MKLAVLLFLAAGAGLLSAAPPERTAELSLHDLTANASI